MASLNDVSQKYKELISVLGNSVFRDDSEKEANEDIVSEVVEMVMEPKGSKKGFSEVLLSKTYEEIIKSF